MNVREFQQQKQQYRCAHLELGDVICVNIPLHTSAPAICRKSVFPNKVLERSSN